MHRAAREEVLTNQQGLLVQIKQGMAPPQGLMCRSAPIQCIGGHLLYMNLAPADIGVVEQGHAQRLGPQPCQVAPRPPFGTAGNYSAGVNPGLAATDQIDLPYKRQGAMANAKGGLFVHHQGPVVLAQDLHPEVAIGELYQAFGKRARIKQPFPVIPGNLKARHAPEGQGLQ